MLFEGSLEYIRHDYDNLIFIPSGDHLVIEGISHGRMSGKSWARGKTPGGRFCNIFKFRDGRISSVHVYLDPDPRYPKLMTEPITLSWPRYSRNRRPWRRWRAKFVQ